MLDGIHDKSRVSACIQAISNCGRLKDILKILIISAMLPLASLGHLRAQEYDAKWVRKRVAEIKESDTVAWRKISWAPSLLQSEKIAKDQGRPVFLFTLDGNLDTGRC